ncbi:ExbD/TolR family protein [Syntrophorhabdus aromaticivorans]|jgi:biopolymer transport protein TolR|uniref:Biopolymer transporter ExbD n=1 Tax=Syntrophorhabdus aromaticivorans TaxID=328301 RepID=A0A351U254_9BACT|nr:biopolymer transporter ExbD [Syntrophorhabdus aromaticivorans]NLW36927.1 biopolymer transporter ExbD [Syntrophorhabdus aromaticivorans]HBA54035.1 biopolymer transporter ExbD [Syntrophorhabdus aromaticivorans]
MKFNRDSKGPLSDINIIPLVDVMLVLLIIFMITAPMMQHGMNIDIPKVTTKPLPAKEEPQILNITRDQKLVLNEKKLTVKDLKPAVQLLFANKTHKEIFLRADKDVSYGFVVSCMGLIREAGVEKINIVTKPLEEQ